jgi:hypothetical protein
MGTVTKTVTIQGSFVVTNATQQPETTKIFNSTPIICSDVTTISPMTIPGSSANIALPMGGVSLAKAVFIRTDQPVTLKIGQNTDLGFQFGPGDGYFTNTGGVPGVFVSTGPNTTNVEAVIAG